MDGWTITVQVSEEGEQLLATEARLSGDGSIRALLERTAQAAVNETVVALTAEWERQHGKTTQEG